MSTSPILRAVLADGRPKTEGSTTPSRLIVPPNPASGNPQSPIRNLLASLAGLALVIGLPLLGAALMGRPLSDFTEFPPLTRHVIHAPFSWPVFLLMAALILAVLAAFLLRRPSSSALSSIRNPQSAIRDPASSYCLATFILTGLVFWTLAWTRFEWFAPLQRHTFTPLWLAYIATVNVLTFRRTGRCLATSRPRAFLALFPVSAAFWWFFEYLNRFTENWYYVGAEGFSRWEYVVFASISFSTVLPAVMGTEELLATFGGRKAGGFTVHGSRFTVGQNSTSNIQHSTFNAQHSTPGIQHRASSVERPASILVLILTALGLAGLAVWPDLLFPLLWLGPLALLAALQTLAGRPTVFTPLRRGDTSRVVRLALAALICGFFWELWNYHSLAKWIYSVPFVDRFHLFEMPLLGYAGYLPFGLECALVADLVLRPETHEPEGVRP